MQNLDTEPSYKKRLRPIYHGFLGYFDKAKMTEHTFVILVAVMIGLLGGYGSVLIHYSIRMFQEGFWQGELNLNTIHTVPWYLKLIVPTFGGIVVGLVIRYIAREAKGHGVPEVMEAIALKNGIIRPRVVLAKLFSSALYIASGGSVGREGPVIQIGSAVGSSIGQFFKVNSRRMRTFVGCGAASGIAAAFNAPVAGALFAVEIILGDFAVPQFSPIVISSVTATIVSRHYLGDSPAFEVPAYHLISPLELVNYAILGFLAGLVAVGFIKTLYYSEDFFDKFNIHDSIKGAIGGLIIGSMGLKFPSIYGVGYDTMNLALTQGYIWYLAMALIFIKILATSVSLGSGGSGGIFAPSLFMGVMLGAFFGDVLNIWFPDWTADPGAYALVAMGGVVGATTRGPITAILIIFEMTNDYKIILPLMITTIIATLVSSRMHKESIYTLKLVRRGINIFAGREINVLRSLKIADIVKQTIELVDQRTPFRKILEKVANSPHNYIYVVDDNDKISGFISMQEIRQAMNDYENLQHLLIAADIARPNVLTVHETDNLDYAMKEFSRTGLDELPVISNGNDHKIVGTIWQRDVIDAYNHQIFLRDMAGETGQSIKKLSYEKSVHVIDKYHLSTEDVPMQFIGKTLESIGLRKKYNLELLLIKRMKNEDGKKTMDYIHPSGKTILKENDSLLIFGTKSDIVRFSKY
ncbi:MAG: chloride channel protein [Calditrichaceae bacterium]|jgi:chloride channel protein, CIC family